jgi:hypothetical protein
MVPGRFGFAGRASASRRRSSCRPVRISSARRGRGMSQLVGVIRVAVNV